MGEILTVAELAALLKISKSQVYELTKDHTRAGEVRCNRLPTLRIGSSVRFRKVDVDSWLAKVAEESRV
jgi:predicted DNA-binding transcriptional regulator AlpA